MPLGALYQEKVVCARDVKAKTSLYWQTGLYLINPEAYDNFRINNTNLFLIKSEDANSFEKLTTPWYTLTISKEDGAIAITQSSWATVGIRITKIA